MLVELSPPPLLQPISLRLRAKGHYRVYWKARTLIIWYKVWLKHIRQNLRYKACPQVLNAMDYGIPQRRKRLWIVGVNCYAAKRTLALAVPTAHHSMEVFEIEIGSKVSSHGLLRWKNPERWNWASSWEGQEKTCPWNCLLLVHFACQIITWYVFCKKKTSIPKSLKEE